MKRLLSLLLLAGAVLGLLGREAAFAHVMPVAKAEQVHPSAAEMSADCARMMGLAVAAPQPDKPCQGMTPDCIAKMGCAVPVALVPPFATTANSRSPDASPLPVPVAPLAGREIVPEPEPPLRLG